jgi:hypothetical protein
VDWFGAAAESNSEFGLTEGAAALLANLAEKFESKDAAQRISLPDDP